MVCYEEIDLKNHSKGILINFASGKYCKQFSTVIADATMTIGLNSKPCPGFQAVNLNLNIKSLYDFSFQL